MVWLKKSRNECPLLGRPPLGADIRWKLLEQLLCHRSATEGAAARKELSGRISNLKRWMRGEVAVCRLRANEALLKGAKAHMRLTDVDGSEFVAPVDTFRAISRHLKARYGDMGAAAHLALQKAASEVRASILDSRGGLPWSSRMWPSKGQLIRSATESGRRQAPPASPASS